MTPMRIVAIVVTSPIWVTGFALVIAMLTLIAIIFGNYIDDSL